MASYGECMGATATPTDAIAHLTPPPRWRHYQEIALAAFERTRAAGQTHIVAPPGAGKTLLGAEMLRRIGRPALIVIPNTAIQGQWLATLAGMGGADCVGTDALSGRPVSCITYQALCQMDDPDELLGAIADERLVRERAQTTAEHEDRVRAELAALTGAGAERHRRDRSRVIARLRREIARGKHGIDLRDLLAPSVQARISALRGARVGTVILDECHHLASLWGYAVRAVIGALGDDGLHRVSLTATPPDGLAGDDAALYDGLTGPVSYTIPTPAVVKEGYLAPYQELVHFTTPTDAERAFIAEHDERFRQLVSDLHADPSDPLSFPAWVLSRLRERRRAREDSGTGLIRPQDVDDGDAELGVGELYRQRPAFVRAACRMLAAAGLALPPGAPRGEEFRQPPDVDDWIALFEDYALRCLATHPAPEAAERYERIAAALSDLGYRLTRRGIRRGQSETDRVLAFSRSKALALSDILRLEDEVRGERLRALVLVEADRPRRGLAGSLAGLLEPHAGTTSEARAAVSDDGLVAHLRPLIVSGPGIRCTSADAPAIVAALCREDPAGGWRAEPGRYPDEAELTPGAGGRAASHVALAGRLFAAGDVRVLIGTRALLGEGWNAPSLNCLIDLSTFTTSVATRQARGRSLRLDPDDPHKVASNWDVVCVDSSHLAGDRDYARFVRRHEHIWAPSEDGYIEAGVSHSHPALSPFAPPSDAACPAINADSARRARDHARARAAWMRERDYEDVETTTLLARRRTPTPEPQRSGARAWLRLPAVAALPFWAGLAAAVVGAVFSMPLLASVGVLLALAWGAGLLGLVSLARRRLDDALPLAGAAQVVLEAYRRLGEMPRRARVRIEPRAGGYLRVALERAGNEETERFTTALDELLAGVANPRYMVTRPRPAPGWPGLVEAWWRVCTGRAAWTTARGVGVPSDFARRRDRADAFAEAWSDWLGPGEATYTRTKTAAELPADVMGDLFDTAMRRRWE